MPRRSSSWQRRRGGAGSVLNTTDCVEVLCHSICRFSTAGDERKAAWGAATRHLRVTRLRTPHILPAAMGDRHFMGLLRGRWDRANTLLCVGLDPDPARFPAAVGTGPDA